MGRGHRPIIEPPPSSLNLAARLGYRLLGRHVYLVGSMPSADWLEGIPTIRVAIA